MSNVTPVYKKDEATDKTNYRPVSVLSAIPKLFEKVQFDQLYESLSPTFSNNMSGFRHGHSCTTALIKLTDDWRMALDKKKEVGVIAIDLSKAFDSICHNLILAKLKAYGVQESALQMMRSFLQDRKQRVKCNGVYSDWLPLRCGVPQGSLLSPLLFNIFMNDINDIDIKSSLRLYADDTTQYESDICPAVLEYSLNQDIIKLSDWLNRNYLHINNDKTQTMVLGQSSYNYALRLSNDMIETKDSLRILGVILNNRLSFKSHVDEILKKAYAKIAALRRLKRLAPANVLLKLYKAYVLPHLEYCSPILLGIGKALSKKLEYANYYGLRTVLNLGNNVSYEAALKVASMRTLEHRRVEQALVTFFKCVKQNGPAYISNFFMPREIPYNLRGSSHNVVQYSYNSQYLHNSFSHIISRIWNQLPTATKSAKSISIFRNYINKSNLAGCQCNKCL